MSGNRNVLAERVALPLLERLEDRRLMSFVPVIHANALVADTSSFGVANTDANLATPQGITITSSGQLWVANKGSGTVTTYNIAGVASRRHPRLWSAAFLQACWEARERQLAS